MAITNFKKKEKNKTTIPTLSFGLLDKVTALQNEVSINFPNKIIGITSVDNDVLSSIFGCLYSK